MKNARRNINQERVLLPYFLRVYYDHVIRYFDVPFYPSAHAGLYAGGNGPLHMFCHSVLVSSVRSFFIILQYLDHEIFGIYTRHAQLVRKRA